MKKKIVKVNKERNFFYIPKRFVRELKIKEGDRFELQLLPNKKLQYKPLGQDEFSFTERKVSGGKALLLYLHYALKFNRIYVSICAGKLLVEEVKEREEENEQKN